MHRQTKITLILPGMVDAVKALPEYRHRSEQEITALMRKDADKITDAELQDMLERQVQCGSITNEDIRAAERAEILGAAEAREVVRSQQEEAQEREYFKQACAALEITPIDANFEVIRRLSGRKLPNGEFLSWRHIPEIHQAMSDGAITLYRTPEEQQRWQQKFDQANSDERDRLAGQIADLQPHKTWIGGREVHDKAARDRAFEGLKRLSLAELQEKLRQIEHYKRLRAMDPEQLKHSAAAERAGQQTEALTPELQQIHHPQQLTEFEYSLAKGYERDVIVGKMPPLPKFWNGQKLDQEFIRKADTNTLKAMFRKHGMAQVNARFHAIKKIGQYQFAGEE
jgi:hypothetical protein